MFCDSMTTAAKLLRAEILLLYSPALFCFRLGPQHVRPLLQRLLVLFAAAVETGRYFALELRLEVILCFPPWASLSFEE